MLQLKKAVSNKDNGKSHLTTVTGSTEKPKTREITKDELAVAKAFGFTEEQFKEYVNRTNKKQEI